MDAFIILGQVPGTDYQLTFNDVLAIYLLAGFLWLIFKERLSLKIRIGSMLHKPFKSKLS